MHSITRAVLVLFILAFGVAYGYVTHLSWGTTPVWASNASSCGTIAVIGIAIVVANHWKGNALEYLGRTLFIFGIVGFLFIMYSYVLIPDVRLKMGW